MYTRNYRSISSMFRSFKRQILWYGPYIIVIYIAYAHFGVEQLDIKMSIATVLGFAVSLVLGFRTSAAYDRWWEARKIWGGIVNDSRNLVRQLLGFTHPAQIHPLLLKIANYQIAWCYVLKDQLRDLDPMRGARHLLTETEIERLSKAHNKKVELQRWIQEEIFHLKSEGKLDSIQMASATKILEKLCDHMGKAERIKNTVFPTQYRSYTHGGIILFTLMLPYGMLASTGPFMIIICALVSFFFSMLEDIAFHLQDPFKNRASDIPMNALCVTIERDLKELIRDENIPLPIEPDKNGILM